MAKQLNVNLAFTADTGRAKAQLQDLQNQLTKIINTPTAGLGQDLVKDINQASYAAAELKVHLDQAMNQRTGSLDFSKLSQSLKQNNISLSEYAEKIRSIGPEGQKAFTMLAQSIASAEVPIRRSNALLSELWVTMKNTVRWQLTSSMLHGFMGAVQSAVGYTKDLNESLNNIRIVTGQSVEQMADFAKEANKAAKSLSTSTLNYTDAALIYYQQGLDDTQVKERTDVTIKMANVSRQSAEEVSDQMTAIWNNFAKGSESLEHYADVMTRLGADTASSSDEIAQGLEKFSAVADMIGLSFDNAAAALATVTATTRQSADVVGTAFKTIFARIQGLSLGETLDDGTNLNKYSKALNAVGINIKEQNGELKDMDSILEEMGAKWKTLSKDQQVALAQTVAGVRQYNQLIALMDNFDFYQQNLEAAKNSTGTLDKQQKIYEESWRAANDRVRASFEDIYNTLISDKFFIGFLNGLADVIDGIDSLMDHMGGLSGAIGALGLIITKVFSKQLATSISNIGYNIKNMLDGGKSVRQEKITTLQSMITSPSDTTSGELNIVEETTNEVINAQIKSQQYLIDNAGKLNEKEQATLQILMDQQKVRGDLAIKAAEEEYQAKERLSDAYAMVVGYHGIKVDNNQNLKNIQDYSKQIAQLKASGDSSQETKNKIAKLNKEIDKNIDVIAQQNGLDSQGKAHLKEYSEALVDSTQKTEARVKATEDATRATDENSNSTQRNSQQARENAQAQEQAGKKIKISAEGFVKGGAAALTMVTAISSLSQAVKTMKDPDIEGWDKFSSVAMSLSMALPMLGSSLSQFGKIAVLANGQTLAQVASTTKLFGPLSKASAGFAKAAGGATTFLGSVAALLPYVAAAVAIIGLLAWGLDKLILTEKEAKENIEKANETFAEQKQILDDLNSSLKTTKDRIDELSKQDTLTVIEKEELAKLKQEQAYLERQIVLQKKLTDAEQKNQATTIKKNYSTANSTLIAGPQTSRQMGLVDENGSYISESADEWFARVTQGLDETSDAYARFEQSYKDWVAENEQITLNWLSENAEAIQQAETDYQSYAQAIADGTIEYNAEDAAAMQNTLSGVRKNIYSDAEYEETFLKPILTNSTAMRQADDSIYHAIAVGSDASGLINSYLQEDLLMAGVSVDEFLNYLTKDINKASENMKNLGIETSEIEKLTAEDWQIITELNFENIKTADELWDALENYKNSKINIEVVGIDTLQTVLDKLNEKQKPMEDALSSYKDNGYLTMDEVQELIAANSEYAKYIVKVGDSYKLATQALTDFRDSEAKEAQALDEMIGLMGQAGQVNKDYITNYTNAWDDLIAKSAEYKEGQYSFTDENDAKLFNQRTQALKENAIAYQEGSITAEEYFTKIGDRISQINSGFHSLDDEIEGNVEQTDLYEATMTAATGSIADGLADLNSHFKSGQVNMDEYYKGTIAGTKALITAHSKTNKNIKKNSDGVWELKEGIDQTTVSSEDYAKAVSDIEQLNAWEKQVSQAEDMQDTVDILTDNYDYLLQYADAFGAVDFTIDNNFDTTAQQFQDLCTSMGEELIDLEANNKASYQRILQGILDQGIQLANGLDTSASELQAAMAKDASLASAVINSSMLESSGTITSVSQAAGNVLSALGDLISNFDYTLSFKPVVVDKGGVHIKEWLEGEESLPFTLPKLGINITGSGGDSVNNFVSALQDAAGYLNTQGSGTGQGGIFDYGKEPEDWTPLDPNKIKTDNIRDKGKDNNYKPEEDRYHEITKEIEKQERALNRLQKAKDQAYGANKLKAIDSEIEATKKLKEANEELYRQQKEKLEEDANALLSLFPEADITNGYIANYNELLLKTTSEEQKKILDQYVSTWEATETTYDKLLDFDNSIKDLKYEKLNYELELKVDIEDAELKRLDYFLNKFSDDFYKMAESAALMMDKIKPTSNMLSIYQENVNKLEKAYQNGDISQEKYIEGLKNARDAIYEQLEALNELDKQMLHYYEDTLSAATDELADHTDHMEHLTSVFEHYQNLLSIIGKSKDYEAMGNFLQGQADTIKDRLSVAQSYYDVLLQQKDEIQAELEAAIKSGDEAKIEMYQKEWDAIVDETDAAQEQVLSLTEEWAEAMKSVIQNNMEKIADTLEKTLTGGTTFDTLMDGFDKLNTRQEEYLTKTNQIYETNKLMRTASKALDETDNKVAKQKLKNFIDETKGLQETTQLSKYELEIQQAKYDLLLAQIALEEAQNAKSTVRLSRDNEGNFGYVYTADQNKIDDAQQAVDDADNKLYNLSLEGQQQYTEKYLQAEQSMYEELKQLQQDYLDGNIASEEEYERIKEQILNHYLGPDGVLTTYQNLYNVAVRTDANATADYWGQEYGRMTQDTETWKTAVNNYLLEIDGQIEEWKNVQTTANQEVGGALSNSKKATEELTIESEKLKDTINDEVIPTISDEIDAVKEQTDAYAAQRAELQALINTYENYLSALDATISANSIGFDKNTDYSALMNEYLNSGGKTTDKAFQDLLKQRNAKIEWLESDAGGNKGSEYWGTKGADTLAYYETLTSGGGTEEQRAWFEKDYMTKDEMLDKLNTLGVSTEELELAINDVKASTDTVGEKITETGNNTNTKIEEVGNNTNSKLEETTNNTNSKIDDSKETLNTSINDSKETLNTSIGSHKDETVKILGDIKSTIESKSGEIIESIGSAAGEISLSVGGAISSIKSDISSLQGEVSSLRGSVTGSAIGSVAGPVGKAVGGIIGGVIGKATHLDSGGYTGDWGPEGKLAVLHEKELVLNQNDTQNLLSTVSLIRELVSMIDAQAANASLFNLMSSPSPNTNTNTLEQKVEITAEFPNVNDRYEIEEAFNNLVNRASQYANKAF